MCAIFRKVRDKDPRGSSNFGVYQTMDIDQKEITYRINEFINSPRFFDAANSYIEQHLHIFSSYKYVVKFISDEGRYVVTIKQTAALLTPSTEFDRTAQALYNFAVEHKLATKSRVAAGLAVSVLGSYMTWKTSPNDKRMKVFSPLPKFMALVEDTFYSYSRALTTLDPERYHLLENFTPRMAGEMAGASVEVYLRGRRLADVVRNLAIFSHRDGGFEILLSIMQTGRLFSSKPKRFITMPFSSIAKKFAISRSQTQKTFAAAAAAGLIKLHENGGKNIELLPAFNALATEVIASVIALAAVSYDMVETKLKASGELTSVELAVRPLRPAELENVFHRNR
jgi:preprotein translocase subunit Sec61beta